MARRLRLHVVYEHGPDLAPFGAAEVRLLRPLTHPLLGPWLDTRFGRSYDGRPVDAVLVDRLISPRLPPALLESLIARVRAAGAPLLLALDDDFLDLALDRPRWAGSGQVRNLHRLLRAADGLMLTTEPLARRLAGFSDNRVVVPNALDERLLRLRPIPLEGASLGADDGGDDGDRPLVLGYMGTFTHASDLAMILPALRAVHARAPGRFVLELVGVSEPAAAEALLEGLPWRQVEVPPGCSAYPEFMPWFTGTLRWDLALAPLADTPFTRCKSDLKHIDYAALGAPGIFSHVPAYSGSVRHRETGWLTPNQAPAWERALETLLADPDLRRRMALGAREALLASRTLASAAPRWLEALQQLVAGARGASAGGAVRPSTVPAPRRAPEPGGREADPAPGPAPGPPAEAPPPPRVHVLYEYGHGGAFEPHASAHLRLLRPLTHPRIAAGLEPRFRPRYGGAPAELVVLDRLWRPDVTLAGVEALIERLRRVGARLVHALDDNLLDLRAERGDWPSEEHEAILRLLLREADALWVTGEPLAERLRREEPAARLRVLPNALDERLLGRGGPAPARTPFGPRPLVIGYMGTTTHAADLAMVLPALQAVCRRHAGRLRIELVGVLERPERLPGLAELPLRVLRPHPGDREYTRFLPWFTGSAGWDIAIAPLRDTPFNRCKSDVKLLDGQALGAAVLCSDVPAYAGSLRQGETGLLVESHPAAWEDALEQLIADEDRRRAIGRAGRRQLLAERVLDRRAPDWADAIQALLG